jgi:uncharacterized protein (DUF1684 family)
MWRMGRDTLFADHPQSALDRDDRVRFRGLRYFPYDPSFRVDAAVEPAPEWRGAIAHSAAGTTPFRRVGRVTVELPGGAASLPVYWLDTYGGGLFLPFRDGTAGATTYGGGRYLLDSAKGADLGMNEDRMVLDFNFAYHPSCVYSSRWSCPLAPPESHIPVPVEAGERLEDDVRSEPRSGPGSVSATA